MNKKHIITIGALALFTASVSLAEETVNSATVKTTGDWSATATWGESENPPALSTTANVNFVSGDVTLTVDANQSIGSFDLSNRSDTVNKGVITKSSVAINENVTLTLNDTNALSSTTYAAFSGKGSLAFEKDLTLTPIGTYFFGNTGNNSFKNLTIETATTLLNFSASSLTIDISSSYEVSIGDRYNAFGSATSSTVSGALIINGDNAGNLGGLVRIERSSNTTLTVDSVSMASKTRMRVVGSLSVTNDAIFNALQNDGTTNVGGNITFNETTQLKSGYLSQTNTEKNAYFNGTITVTAGSYSFGKIFLQNGLALNLNSTNAIKGGGLTQGNADFYVTTYGETANTASTATITVGANNDFGKFIFADNSQLTINSTTGTTLVTIGAFEAENTGDAFTVILDTDFADNTVKVMDIGNIDFVGGELASNVYFGSVSDENRAYIVADNAGTGYWINHTGVAPAVPEPAELAVIFGAVAIAFVTYRRRK